MLITELLDFVINLFDCDGASAEGSSGDNTASNNGETTAPPVNTKQGKKGEYNNVVFGKQTESNPVAEDNHSQDGTDTTNVKVTSNAIEERKKAYRDFIDEHKDLYTEDVQKIINRRFKETKAMESRINEVQPIIDILKQRYKIDSDDLDALLKSVENDDAYWNEEADELGMTVEQLKRMKKLERENAELLRARNEQSVREQADAQMQKWYREAEEIKNVYPEFDINVESQNPDFLKFLKLNVPMQQAYELCHLDDIKNGIAKESALKTEKKVVDSIRAKGNRPTENGISSQSAFTVKDDVSKLTKKDRSEIVRRVARGDKIEF